jgi:poly-gamma-glutamate synthesis protein (capsule biosynthesis protein)
MGWLAAVTAFLFASLANFLPAHTPVYRALPLPAAPHEETVLFGGDMLFDRTVRSTIDEKGGDFIFSCIDPVLRGADLVVANLEGPITATTSRSLGSAVGSPENYVFTFSTSTAPLLAAHHIRMVNLGNNHILNFGIAGLRSTTAALGAASVGYFGDPASSTVAESDAGGVPLSFINYNEYQSPFSGGTSASTTIAQVEAARARGRLAVVYTHWGQEYATSAPEYVRTLGHRFVEAGAALVVGSSPHVVEESETYRGVPIYYSLGNFIFDQYWNDEVDHGLLLRVTFTDQGVKAISELPIILGHDRRTCPVTEAG